MAIFPSFPLSFPLRSYANGLLSRCTSGTALGRLQCQPEGTLRTDCTGECAHQWGGQAFRWAYEIKKIKVEIKENVEQQTKWHSHIQSLHCGLSPECVWLGAASVGGPSNYATRRKVATSLGLQVAGAEKEAEGEGAAFATKHSLLFKHHFTFKKSFKYLHSLLNRFSFL